MTKTNITSMSDEHTSWLSALEFYKGELKIAKERLTEIAGKNTADDAVKETEHFENQLKVQNENIDELHHAISDNLAKAAAQAQEKNAGYIDTVLVITHNHQKGKFLSLEKVINELRHEFNLFAAKWM